jgi:hypothetical protein
MKTYLLLKGDYNDADYVTDFDEVSQGTEDYIRKLLPLIKEHRGDVEAIEEDPRFREIVLDGEEFEDEDEADDIVADAMLNLLPSAPDAMSVHRIDTIQIYKIESIESLY